MISSNDNRPEGRAGRRPVLVRLAVAASVALLLTACRLTEEPVGHVAGWTLVDARQRHPIMVSEQPANMTLRVAAGANGLTARQRSQAYDFINRYSTRDGGSARILIGVPSGSANEAAAVHAVADLRQLLRSFGVSESDVAVQPYNADGSREAPVRVSYSRFIAEGPVCGQWPTNLAQDPRNLPYPNFGCSQQRNLAAQVANPADLLGPRTMAPGSAERRDTVWNSYVKGESTIAKKGADEKVQVKNAE